jgi:hypothetical protein
VEKGVGQQWGQEEQKTRLTFFSQRRSLMLASSALLRGKLQEYPFAAAFLEPMHSKHTAQCSGSSQLTSWFNPIKSFNSSITNRHIHAPSLPAPTHPANTEMRSGMAAPRAVLHRLTIVLSRM